MLSPSKMREDIQEIPVAIEWLLTEGASAIKDAARAYKEANPISTILSAHATVEQVALARRINLDVPRHLSKVAETI